ncbi:MAG: ABC transporter ATP-binding protein [Acidobacteriota bacterium]|jgi:ABC-2 type transport system ATP-binding protein
MIEVRNLSKRFDKIQAVDAVSFRVAAGEIYGLLGPNGAGKTTTLTMLAGLLTPDDGTITVDGADLAARPGAVKASLGVVPQETAIYEELTARENLRFWAGMYGLSGRELEDAVGRALDQVGLSARADEPVRRFSGGMKRRLNLSLGLAHQPRAVLLDEPTVGIDPQARLNILQVVRDVAAAGTAVLYTTHYLEEAESLCDRIGILDHGALLAEGTLAELKRMVGESDVITVRGAFQETALRPQLEGLAGIVVRASAPGRLVLAAPAGGGIELLEAIFAAGLPLTDVSIEPPSLNALFLKLTGRELRD